MSYRYRHIGIGISKIDYLKIFDMSIYINIDISPSLGSSRLLFRYVYFFGGTTLLLLAKSQFKSLENHNLQIKSSKNLLMVLNERLIY